jgi:hypothetical protein
MFASSRPSRRVLRRTRGRRGSTLDPMGSEPWRDATRGRDAAPQNRVTPGGGHSGIDSSSVSRSSMSALERRLVPRLVRDAPALPRELCDRPREPCDRPPREVRAEPLDEREPLDDEREPPFRPPFWPTPEADRERAPERPREADRDRPLLRPRRPPEALRLPEGRLPELERLPFFDDDRAMRRSSAIRVPNGHRSARRARMSAVTCRRLSTRAAVSLCR